ncbi:MAG TPA: HEAT repeat domain-containing protein [Tepidisphaeraceae bacterium]|nr:HEAT repeat domain-containing protein [Tepidisphaeraceae bacterium]
MQTQTGPTTPSTPSRFAELVSRMPRPVEKGQWTGILGEVDDAEVRGAVEQLYAGGREAVVGLVDMLAEPEVTPRGEGEEEPRRTDSQARHALHALVTYACGKGEESRRAVSAALASTLNGRRPNGARAFVARQLVLCGGAEAAPALGKQLGDEAVYADAAMALEKVVGPEAAEQFRAALASPGAAQWPARQRAAVVKGLGVVRDANSVEVLRKAAGDAEPEVRLAAVWALARTGDAGAADVVTKVADEMKGSDRFRATDACLLLAETLAGAGKNDEAKKIYRHLHDTRTAPDEQHVRRAVEGRI